MAPGSACCHYRQERGRPAREFQKGTGGMWNFSKLVAAIAVTPLGLAAITGAAKPASFETITGSGSSWGYIALSQWINDVAPKGLTIDFNPDGSQEGLVDWMQGSLTDFAASDVPFANGKDKLGGEGAQHPAWGYSYLPYVAGGVALPYHIAVHGKLITNLRLSGSTLMEIFTGKITNWDNAQITRENGRQLPKLRIIPVVRADGSGATYFFSSWLAHEFPSQWNAFCDRVHPGITPPCGPTEFYPSNWGNAKAEDGANNVMDFITSSSGNGAIGYDEYAYVLNSDYPTAMLSNASGHYVAPTSANVTTTLTKAKINENPKSPNYLQENLNNVYSDTNPVSYPLSYYGYLIVPRTGTRLPPIFNTAAGRTLSTFIIYALCTGQAQVSALGYAPLPPNLVRGGLKQVALIPGHVAIPPPAKCP
jgi:ABC-type phosphate transport system substrate-binding protein